MCRDFSHSGQIVLYFFRRKKAIFCFTCCSTFPLYTVTIADSPIEFHERMKKLKIQRNIKIEIFSNKKMWILRAMHKYRTWPYDDIMYVTFIYTTSILLHTLRYGFESNRTKILCWSHLFRNFNSICQALILFDDSVIDGHEREQSYLLQFHHSVGC